jgi:hypothetical protein
MPVSDHEYMAATPQGLKASFILTRYYTKKFGDESMIYPEYLDLFDKTNKINAKETTGLILHVKIVNIKRSKCIVWWAFKNDQENQYHVLYQGKLPRKDLAIQLPTSIRGKHEYEVAITVNQEEPFRIWGEYHMKGGSVK